MNIDEYISIKLISYISHYEKILKKYISDKVCECMVSNGSLDCCDYSFFETMKTNSMEIILDCFVLLDMQYNKNGKLELRDQNTYESRNRVIEKIIAFANGNQTSELNYYVSYYYSTKHSIPFYILIGSLTFTNLIVLFGMFNRDLQNDFIKNIHKKNFIGYDDVVSAKGKHDVIRRIRNIIHHHEPLIPYLCKNEYLGFEIKKAAIKLLKKVYEDNECLNKLIISSYANFEIIESLTSNSSKKLVAFINLIK